MSDLTIDDGALTSRDEWVTAGLAASYIAHAAQYGYLVGSSVTHQARRDRNQWLESVRDQILDALSLEENWDTYGSPPPDVRAAERAGRLMELVCNMAHVLPVPRTEGTSEGGLSIEWYQPDVQFRFVLSDSGREVVVFFKDRTTGEVWEGPFESASQVIRKAFSLLSS